MSWKPFLPDDGSGIVHWRRNNGDGTVSYRAEQENDPILDANKAAANHNDGYTKSRDMRRVATIPMQLVYHWRETEGWDALDPANGDRLVKRLNDPEFMHLRTAVGVLGYSNGVIR